MTLFTTSAVSRYENLVHALYNQKSGVNKCSTCYSLYVCTCVCTNSTEHTLIHTHCTFAQLKRLLPHIKPVHLLILEFRVAKHPVNSGLITPVNYPSKSLDATSEALTQWQTN